MNAAGTALVTDAALRTSLYTIRCLGRHGVRVTVAERAMREGDILGALSRYSARCVTVPDNRSEPDAWAQAMLALAAEHDVLMPMGMHAIEPVARRLADFRAVTRVALADWETIGLADRTRDLLDVAVTLGVRVPRRYRLADYPSEYQLAQDVRYPAIVKTGLEAGLAPRDRYAVVRDEPALLGAVERMRPITDDPIIQELIVGPGIGVELLYDFEHRPVACFAHQRLREYPLTGGPSTYCVSIHHPEAEKRARTLLDHLRWVGLAMVEFKIDASTGEPVLMEINPRPWGSMALPIRAGTEFPWLLYQLARDGRLDVQPDWKDGVRLRFLVNDLQAALAEWRRARGLRARLDILSSILDPRVKEGLLWISDPRPSLAYVTKGIQRALHGQAA